jgi:hypothetical protein
MDISAFQLSKNSAHTNQMEWLHNTPIVSYGRIIRVIDIQTVDVEPVVQASAAKEVCTVTLISLSSDLLEVTAYPKTGDTVLLLFLQRYDKKMFIAKSIIKNRDAIGYNKFSGIGILMSTIKGFARTTISCHEDGDKPKLTINSDAETSMSLNGMLGLTFCRLVAASDDEAVINIIFGEGRPLMEQFLSSVLREHGFWKTPEGDWQELNAPVIERYSIYSPITRDVQGAQTTAIGLGMDKAGNPVETDAPVTETIHGKAPVARDIRSPQTITIGIGNDETEDPSEQREAPVTINMGETADIDFDSRSGITAGIAKDVDVSIGGDRKETVDGDVEETVGGNQKTSVDGSYEEAVTGSAKYSSADTDIKSTAPVGINDGLYITGLQPYLTAETNAAAALMEAAVKAAPQLALLDALSGGTGFITGLGTAIAAFCTAIQSADTAAHAAVSKAVK